MKSWPVNALTVMVSMVIAIGLAELALRYWAPQRYMMPRFQASSTYGHALPQDTQMIHAKPGNWKFVYTINKYGYRGAPLAPEKSVNKPRIVILGDSHSMGMGVMDDEVYAKVMSKSLGERYHVVNLGIGGYGLPQEIRWYYEFGRLYKPKIVILQFTANDPRDGLYSPIATLINGELKFKNVTHSMDWLKKIAQNLPIQYSQLYNLSRDAIYRVFRKKDMDVFSNQSESDLFYIELLDYFTNTLKYEGIKIIFISTNGHLKKFARIEAAVEKLEKNGTLDYVEVEGWFDGLARSEYGSPEGHIWGARGHEIIGTHLAKHILKLEEE